MAKCNICKVRMCTCKMVYQGYEIDKEPVYTCKECLKAKQNASNATNGNVPR